MRPFRSGFAEVDGLRLHYLDWPGREPTVLCLPGITANAHAFAGLAEELSPRHRVVAMDLRGRGESDKPASGYDVGTHVADVAGLVDGVGIRRLVVVGWSLGAKVALALTAAHPQRVERLVLLDPPVETSPAAVAALGAFWSRLDDTYDSVDAFLARMRASWVFTDWSPYVERYLRADVEEGSDGVVRHRVPRHVPRDELRAEDRYPTRSFYSRISCPVLILRAVRPLVREGDEVLAAEDAREMATSLSQGSVIDIDEANHFSILLGTPPRVLQAVTTFLGDRPGVPAAEPETRATDGPRSGETLR